ncbi:MAG: porin [Alistipes sp.]
MKQIILLSLLFVVALLPLKSMAQHEVEALSRRLDSLEAVVNHQNERAKKWAKVLDKLPNISGYMQLKYIGGDGNSTFSVHHVRLSLAGAIYRNLIDFKVQVEFASPKLMDAYIRVTPWTAFNVQVGQFKVPFTIGNTDYGPLQLETIGDPLVLLKLVGMDDVCGLKSSGRDVGAALYGGFWNKDGRSIIGYNFGVFNGSGINTLDENKSKDIVARLTIRPLRDLQISGSYYWGECGKDYQRRVRYSVGAAYEGRLFARAEYICGTTGDLKSGGWYATAGFHITPKIAPVVRYDTFCYNESDADTRQSNYVIGIAYRPWKHLRLQGDYTYQHFTDETHSNASLVQLMVTGLF